MSEHTAGTAHHNNERIWSDFGRSVMGKKMTVFEESSVLCCIRVSRSREEVGCSQASMLNDVRGTSQTRKQVRGSCSGSRFPGVTKPHFRCWSSTSSRQMNLLDLDLCMNILKSGPLSTTECRRMLIYLHVTAVKKNVETLFTCGDRCVSVCVREIVR